ncbi:rodlin [Streptomyces huiliensis]|uniref:rodlin n=1 Tax=Streptomyces huiliensis TaxID=2876027 RepID=UPI001CBD1FA7|nr:rodlin [Streptomyces huiliensis]MBZ4321825.1 RdlA protein [Streptomyces huiliensis]
MLKKAIATAAVTASAIGVMATPAMAVGADEQDTANANGAKVGYGNTHTGGKESPQMSLIQGSLNKLCLGFGRVNVQNIVALINIGLQDIPILSSEQEQVCADNSTISDGDDPLSHILDELPILSGNGSANGGYDKGGYHKG